MARYHISIYLFLTVVSLLFCCGCERELELPDETPDDLVPVVLSLAVDPKAVDTDSELIPMRAALNPAVLFHLDNYCRFFVLKKLNDKWIIDKIQYIYLSENGDNINGVLVDKRVNMPKTILYKNTSVFNVNIEMVLREGLYRFVVFANYDGNGLHEDKYKVGDVVDENAYFVSYNKELFYKELFISSEEKAIYKQPDLQPADASLRKLSLELKRKVVFVRFIVDDKAEIPDPRSVNITYAVSIPKNVCTGFNLFGNAVCSDSPEMVLSASEFKGKEYLPSLFFRLTQASDAQYLFAGSSAYEVDLELLSFSVNSMKSLKFKDADGNPVSPFTKHISGVVENTMEGAYFELQWSDGDFYLQYKDNMITGDDLYGDYSDYVEWNN